MQNMNHIANLRFREISDQAREVAKQQTVELLKKLDIKTCDEIRRSFELSPEALGFITEGVRSLRVAQPEGDLEVSDPRQHLLAIPLCRQQRRLEWRVCGLDNQ